MGPGPINQGQHTFSPSFVICGEQSNTTPCAGLTKKSDFSPEAGSAEDIRERRGGGFFASWRNFAQYQYQAN